MARQALDLRVVDGLHLHTELREALRPAEVLYDRQGTPRRLPRWYYEVPDEETARRVELAPGFLLREFLMTDLREARVLRHYPRYVPCAITLLAASLGVVRQKLGAPVFISANGGYRSASHEMTVHASPHCWGAAADIYRIGDTYLETPEVIHDYAGRIHDALPGLWVKTGEGELEVMDHVHVDIGHATMIPRQALDRPSDHGNA